MRDKRVEEPHPFQFSRAHEKSLVLYVLKRTKIIICIGKVYKWRQHSFQERIFSTMLFGISV